MIEIVPSWPQGRMGYKHAVQPELWTRSLGKATS